MKRTGTILIAAVLAFVFAFAGCKPKRGAHIWEEKWTTDENGHWHECLDDGCNQKNELDYHEFALKEVIEDSTCSELGRGIYACGVCGYEKEDSIAMKPHELEVTSKLKEETCFSAGYGTYKCKNCTYTVDGPIPETGEHNFALTWSADENGHFHACQNTSENGNGTFETCPATTEPEPHVRDDGTRTEPQGTNDGWIDYKCKVCGYLIESVIIPAEGVMTSFEITIKPYLFSGAPVQVGKVVDDAEKGTFHYVATLVRGMADSSTEKKYEIGFANATDSKGNPVARPPFNEITGYFYDDRGAGKYVHFDPLGNAKDDDGNTVTGIPIQLNTFTPDASDDVHYILTIREMPTSGELWFVMRYEVTTNGRKIVRAEVRLLVKVVNEKGY